MSSIRKGCRLASALAQRVQIRSARTAWFSTSSFAQAIGHFGSEGSNSMIGPGLQDWDMAAIKNVRFFERYSLQLRGEFFNAFNHTNWNAVDTSMGDAAFGQVTSTHVPRRVQIGAKINF
jgi:hypothetical protein